MSQDLGTTLADPRVALALVEARYGASSNPQAAPELPCKQAETTALCAVRSLFRSWGLDAHKYDTSDWNPLGEWIPPGSRILLKPNLVTDVNQSGAGIECLVTHVSFIEAVLEYVLLARPSSILIGDAPIQGCNFARLQREMGLEQLVNRFRDRGITISVQDFRRTILAGTKAAVQRFENQRSLDEYVLFDLGRDSLLEDLRADAQKFRVTMYNPDLMRNTHAPGKHQYLIAREVMDADVVLNLPKLKSHKKTGITGAIKNMVGINGNKEFLPHHRKGGSDTGGDCYCGSSTMKRAAEHLLDRTNRLNGGLTYQMFTHLAGAALTCAVKLGENDNLEGSWYGNDTIWRTSLDLQRILHHGRADHSVARTVQRRVIHITDAIIGGEGDGPLAPVPVESGFITGALNVAAAEWTHALLMGFDPQRIPLVRHAFDSFTYPLAAFTPEDIVVLLPGDRHICVDNLKRPTRPFAPPRGWQGHCELSTNVAHLK